MPSCAFMRCTNSSRNKNKCQGGITFHSEILWNPKHINYKRRPKRSDARNEIATELFTNIPDIERKIKNLTSHYFREKKRVDTSKKSCAATEDIYHSKWFPQDELCRYKWQQVVRRQRREPDWQPTNNSRVCSMHFKSEDMYATNKGYMKILKTAVPYFRSEFSPIIQIVKTESLESPSTSSAGPSTSKVQETPEFYEVPLETPRCASPSGLSDIGSSDLEGALDTPAVLYLKKQLREREEQFKETLMKKDEEIELLKKANKRLNQKNTTLRQLLAKMKKKLLLLKLKTKDESDDDDLEPSHDS